MGTFVSKMMTQQQEKASKPAGILDLAPEVRIQIWEKLSSGDQKKLRETCITVQSDIDYLVGVNGILDGGLDNVDWISQVRLKHLRIVGKHFTEYWERTYAFSFFNQLGEMLERCHPNLSSLHLTVDTFNIDGFEGERLRDLQVSALKLSGSNLTALDVFLLKQHRLERLVCDLSVSWVFYIPVLWNCSESLTIIELGHIPKRAGFEIDIVNWNIFPVFPKLNTFKLGSLTPEKPPYPLQCLHTMNFPNFHLSGITELELIHVKLSELEVLLILSETDGHLKTVNLQYFRTRVNQNHLHDRLENSLREGKLESLILCDTQAVTMDQIASNESLRRACRRFGYLFSWEYPYEKQGYGYKLQLKRKQAELCKPPTPAETRGCLVQ